VRLWVTSLSRYIGSVFFMHTSTAYGQHLIKSHRFPLPPVPWPLPPRCPPPQLQIPDAAHGGVFIYILYKATRTPQSTWLATTLTETEAFRSQRKVVDCNVTSRRKTANCFKSRHKSTPRRTVYIFISSLNVFRSFSIFNRLWPKMAWRNNAQAGYCKHPYCLSCICLR